MAKLELTQPDEDNHRRVLVVLAYLKAHEPHLDPDLKAEGAATRTRVGPSSAPARLFLPLRPRSNGPPRDPWPARPLPPARRSPGRSPRRSRCPVRRTGWGRRCPTTKPCALSHRMTEPMPGRCMTLFAPLKVAVSSTRS
jgi:hypothetical protein